MAWIALGILVLQLLVGALNVWIADIYEIADRRPPALATLLWGHLFGINLQLYRVPEPYSPRDRRRTTAEVNA